MSVFIMKESKQKLLLFDQLHRRGKWGGGRVQVKVNVTRPKSPIQFEDEQQNVAMDSDPG